jgi:transposase-like protein
MRPRIFCIGCGRCARTITEAEYLGFVKGKKNRWRCGGCEASRLRRNEDQRARRAGHLLPGGYIVCAPPDAAIFG